MELHGSLMRMELHGSLLRMELPWFINEDGIKMVD